MPVVVAGHVLSMLFTLVNRSGVHAAEARLAFTFDPPRPTILPERASLSWVRRRKGRCGFFRIGFRRTVVVRHSKSSFRTVLPSSMKTRPFTLPCFLGRSVDPRTIGHRPGLFASLPAFSLDPVPGHRPDVPAHAVKRLSGTLRTAEPRSVCSSHPTKGETGEDENRG